ncbi:MAG: glycoside hydrolase family 5 protein [Ruminococcaceae bacterium]|nr:glycoside hydrolase family 5 protein [Oscillospiraceae bacterium]
MTDNEKIMIAGCAAGAAAATVPAVYGFMKATARQPICDKDFLRAEDGGFISECGAPTVLRGINLNDDLFWYKKDGLDESSKTADVFAALEERFGRYGTRQLAQKYNEGFITASDIKKIAKLGANCVRIPLRYKFLFSKENCKGDIDFDRLDYIIEKCRKAGLYVILDLHSAPGFQNTDSACGKNEESVLFSSSKEGFEARNATVRLWTQIAAHYKDEPAVAAYDLLNRPLNRIARWEESLDMLHKFYRRLLKAIRNVDEKHIIIFEAAGAPHTLPSPEKFKGENIAYGIYSHCNTTFEIQALVNGIKKFKESGIPFVICKLRAEENLASSLEAMNDNGISWLAGDYKGSGLKSAFLYGGSVPEADLTFDSYDVIGEKWSKPLATKNFELNKEMSTVLKNAFKYGAISIVKPEGKPKFRAKMGSRLIYGK